ncbi:MAG: FtsX-like permease family protein [Pirellula sp.]|jgi:lipoprotein-releasing system permease protein|nr:FtsX-like permease family protein [Pirellula sp.]
MYKLLLCLRYLRTRWIALASIVSVTLGVATLIVVNSVMDGFTVQMQERMHGILSDLVVETRSTMGIAQPHWYEERIRARLGESVSGVTTVVTLPAMLTFQHNGNSLTQQINLIGIDQKTYASVSDFSKYLLHPENRQQLNFLLKNSGYAPEREQLQPAGWEYRKPMARYRKATVDQLREDALTEQQRYEELQRKIREQEPSEAESSLQADNSPQADTSLQDVMAGPSMQLQNNAKVKPFDAEVEQRTGIVLGIGIGSVRGRDMDGKVQDYFFLRPGDDVQVTFPNAGTPPRGIDESFTIVDFYESKMSEYDATFAFVPIEKLQHSRGMINPQSGVGSVTSIQVKLKPGTDLNAARDALRDEFPPSHELVEVRSWRDTQGPLLAAVQMETTILNILLFMIIAVAGFGILATFFMIVVEKTRDIGVLKALGASSQGVATIFLGYGVLLGSVGAGVGVVCGLLFVWKINDIAKVIEWITGREVFDPTVYYFDSIPTMIQPFMLVWVTLGSILIAVLASVLPSIRAARMHPVEALRYE